MKNPLAAALLAATLAPCVFAPAHAAGLDIHGDPGLAEISLPVYPGAVKKKTAKDDNGGLSFGLWGDTFGVHLAAQDFESGDGVESVAAFYREALTAFGPVLDCGASAPPARDDASAPRARRSGKDGKDGKDGPVTCGDDKPPAGGHLFRVGTERDHRNVEIRPGRHGGTRFQLVRIEARGID